MFDSLPVFGVCGYSGSGKTTLLARILPRLVRRGLRVAVVKHDVHGIDRDCPDKDSDRLFLAGADVIVRGPGESLSRSLHQEDASLEWELDRLAARYDLILLEGFKRLPCRKTWLLGRDEHSPPDDLGPFDPILPWAADRDSVLENVLLQFVSERSRTAPVFGCVLIGGRSTRMGCPKHLLPDADGAGRTWLHRTVSALEACCSQVVLAGRGDVPEDLRYLPHLPDSPGTKGPTAGLLAAMRWAPRATWLLTACDLPLLSRQAVSWVLSQRRPGVWALLPRVLEGGAVEPLLAWYDFRCRKAIESIAAWSHSGLREISRHPKSRIVKVPVELVDAWKDADTPEAASRWTTAIRTIAHEPGGSSAETC